MSEENKMTLSKATDLMIDRIIKDIETKTNSGMKFPDGYNAQNAVISAMFAIKEAKNKDKQLALSVCTPDSIHQAVWEMAVKGLRPDLGHCYWIVYGNKLTMFESYFGIKYRAKRADPNIRDIYAEVVYEKDEFKYVIQHGTKIVTVHNQNPENIDLSKIRGAYATILYNDGTEVSEYMSMQQIRNSWSKGQQKGEGDTHILTPEMMAKRTVTKRLCIMTLNTSLQDNSALLREQGSEEVDNLADENEATELIDITLAEEEVVEPISDKPKKKVIESVNIEIPDSLQ